MIPVALPPEVDDEEYVVRAIKTPYHYNVKKGCLRPAAFRPRVGNRVISVIRGMMGPDFCKNKGMAADGYQGLGVLQSGAVRASGSEVLDAPRDFVGHAHIDHGFPCPPQDEPAKASENEQMIERCKALVGICRFFLDPVPGSQDWKGPSLFN